MIIEFPILLPVSSRTKPFSDRVCKFFRQTTRKMLHSQKEVFHQQTWETAGLRNMQITAQRDLISRYPRKQN